MPVQVRTPWPGEAVACSRAPAGWWAPAALPSSCWLRGSMRWPARLLPASLITGKLGKHGEMFSKCSGNLTRQRAVWGKPCTQAVASRDKSGALTSLLGLSPFPGDPVLRQTMLTHGLPMCLGPALNSPCYSSSSASPVWDDRCVPTPQWLFFLAFGGGWDGSSTCGGAGGWGGNTKVSPHLG